MHFLHSLFWLCGPALRWCQTRLTLPAGGVDALQAAHDALAQRLGDLDEDCAGALRLSGARRAGAFKQRYVHILTLRGMF